MSTTVLYIAGTGRSGSTLLASILGEVDGVFAAGEVRYLWQRGLAESRLCGCGVPVRDCPVWSAVLAHAGHLDEPTRIDELFRCSSEPAGSATFPRSSWVTCRPGINPARSASTIEDRAALGEVYAAIAGATGSRVIVDSSKLPAYANVLTATPGIDLRIVHLIRDPRGAAHSWSSRKPLTDGAARTHMEQIGPAKSAVLWDVWNLSGGLLFNGPPDRYLRLRYEDFIANPQAAVRRILSMVGMEDALLPFVGGSEAVTSFNHSVAGNPDRLRHGLIRLRPDDRWRTAMAPPRSAARQRAHARRSCSTMDIRCVPPTPSAYAARRSSIALPRPKGRSRAQRGGSGAMSAGSKPRAGLASVEEDELNPITG